MRPHRRTHPDTPHASGRGDAVDWDRHGSRAPAPHRNRGHRSRSVAALARRAWGAFLLVTFALPAFAPTASVAATVIDDEPGRLDVSLDRTSVAEGAGAATITVTVSHGSGTVVPSTSTAVAMSVGAGAVNPATPGTDFTAVRDFTITIPADTASATGTFTFTPTGDDLVERDEAVLVGISRILDIWTILNGKAS